MSKIELWEGDCLELMKKIPSNSIDMICCDLPYGLTRNAQDVRLPFPLLWEQYERVIKDNGCIALFAQGQFYIDMVNSNPKLFRYDLIWDKRLVTGFLNSKRMPLRAHEQIAIFYKKLPCYHPQFTEGEPLHSKGRDRTLDEPVNQNYGKYANTDNSRCGSTIKYPTSILRFDKPHPSVAKHRTAKPVALLEWLIKSYTNDGDIVLDNCMGSGSTGVAAVKCGRGFIGIELDSEYFSIAERRINDICDR